ncbi:MAG TPA: Mrp/NBP35 family ATP-binding protein [Gemmatimonadales bacterium]|nr:Mrp/NBP35 family ATP-binding protein [Gemmatimonadales bacterium]
MTDTLHSRVLAALRGVTHPARGDVLTAGLVRDLAVTDAGEVSFTFLLGREDPATLVRQVRKAVEAVPGVEPPARIQVTDPAGPAPATHGPPSAAPAPAPAPGPAAAMELPHLGRIIAVSSGKGGVGKSTVAVNLAVALAEAGHRVGMMDADVYGPNVPRMMGVFERPMREGNQIVPLEAYGVKLMSLGFLLERDAPVIWRGPIIMKVIHQFLHDVAWGELDYLIVDMPPGTGDAQLSLAQATKVSAAVIVTTPQVVAIGDALRGAKMFEKVGVPVAGVVENMSGFSCPHCGEHSDIFLAGGGQRLAEELGVPLLGKIPLQPGLPDDADLGRPIVLAQPASPAATALRDVAQRVVEEVAGLDVSLPTVSG